MRKAVAVFLLMAFSAAACAPTAEITQIDHTIVYGRIMGGTPASVIIDQEDGREHRISRRDIKSVSYPGSVLAGLGAGLLAAGILTAVLGLSAQNNAVLAGALAPTVTGLTLFIVGGSLRASSRNAFLDNSQAFRRDPVERHGAVWHPLNPPVLHPEGPPQSSFP